MGHVGQIACKRSVVLPDIPMALPSIANLFATFSAAERDDGKGSGGEVRGLSLVERLMKGSFRFTSSSRDRDMVRVLKAVIKNSMIQKF